MARTAPTGSRIRSGVLLLSMLTLTGCATTAPKSGAELPGLRLQAFGDTVALQWAADTPLGRSARRTDVFEMLATYQSPAGLVTDERISTGRAEQSGQAVALKLPGTLRNEPRGPVCLRLVKNRRQVIPLRVAAAGQTSDSFRYAAWEPLVTRRTQAGVLQVSLDSAVRQRRRLGGFIVEVDQWKAERDLSDASQCDTLVVSVNVTQPKSAVHPTRRARAAREQCVIQFADLTDWMSGARPDLKPVALSEEIAQVLSGKSDEAGANQLRDDVARFAPMLSAGANRRLPVSSLGLTSTTKGALARSGGKPNAASASAIVGAYSVCLSEATEQFKLAHDAWVAESSTNEDRSAARTRVIRNECRRVFERGAGFAEQAQSLDAEASVLQQRLAEIQNVGYGSLPDQIALTGRPCDPDG